MTNQHRAEMYLEFLREEGFAPKIDDDGDVIFKYEGGTFLILLDDKDEEYFKLVYPAFWPIETEHERLKALRVAFDATANTKVAKVYIIKDNAWAAIEMFCDPPETVKPVFARCLSALRTVVRTFKEEMRE